ALPPILPRFPYTTLFRSRLMRIHGSHKCGDPSRPLQRAMWHQPSMVAEDREFLISNIGPDCVKVTCSLQEVAVARVLSALKSQRSEEHTSELQSRENLVC